MENFLNKSDSDIVKLEHFKYELNSGNSEDDRMDDEDDSRDANLAIEDTVFKEELVHSEIKVKCEPVEITQEDILDLDSDIILPQASQSQSAAATILKQKKELKTRREMEEEEREKMQIHTMDASTSLQNNVDTREDQINSLKSLLTTWNQVELLDQLIKEKVFVNVLKIIKRHHIEKLLKNFDMGTQIVFEHNLEMWRNSIGLPLNDYLSNFASSINVPSPPPSVTSYFDAGASLSSAYSQPTTSDEGNAITLANILNETAKGVMLVKYYKKFGRFQNQQRTLLIQTVAQYFEEKGVLMPLSTSYRLEREILERFPTEKLEYYRTRKRGKLYNKCSNLKSSFKTAVSQHLMKKTQKVLPTKIKRSEKQLDPEPNAEASMKALKYDNLSEEEFEMYWKSCGQHRLQQIRNREEGDVFKIWPHYKRPSGFRLIDMDYKILNDNANGLLDNWETCVKKLVTFLKSSVKDKGVKILLESLSKPDLSENSRDALILWGLHGYLVPTNRLTKKDDVSGKMNITKFTIKDSQESFLFIGKTTEEIEDHLVFLQNEKKPIQPLIFCTGQDITTIEDIFIYFNGIKYNFYNFLGTVDICFKIFFVFNLDFPKESLMFWSFIESFFFKLKSAHSFTKVHELSEYLSQND